MGFGLLFIGYFASTVAAFAFPEIAGFTGYALMILALMSLSEYDKKFAYTLLPAIPTALIYFFLSLEMLIGYFTPYFTPSELIGDYLYAILNAMKLVFHVMLCFSIRGIASDTGADKIVFPATRNAFIYTVCYALMVVTPYISGAGKYLVPVTTLLYIVSIVLNHIMIFSAYMRICDESDVDMEIKKTNIKWYDKLVEKNAEREQKAADETKAYFQAKYDRKMRQRTENAKKSNHPHKGKKKK